MIRRTCLSLAAAALVAAPALAHDAHMHHAMQEHHPASHAHHAGASAAAPAGADVELSQAPLLDVSGKRVQLARDVLAGRIAVVNFVYTHCTTVCPVTSATFELLQRKLGDALGRDVVLVSITVDPLRDTPWRLREFASRYDAGAGWHWLTGAKPDVDEVLKGFGAYTPDFADHPAMVLVGMPGSQQWTRFLGFPSVEQLLSRVTALQAERSAAAHPHAHEHHAQR